MRKPSHEHRYIITPTPVTPVNGVYALPNGLPSPVTGQVTSVNTDLAIPYYGKLPGGQDVIPGAYTDTVTLQVTF